MIGGRAIGGALALGAALATTSLAFGADDPTETVFVPVVPCRLVDTRPATNVGPQSAPLPAGQPIVFNAHEGSDGDSECAIPATATAIGTNVTAVGANAPSFLTLYPADADRPDTSNLNYLPGAPPTPNGVTIPLASNGGFAAFNRNGTINVIIDINGYYQPSDDVGAPGPQGPAGPAGTPGADGADGADGRDARLRRISPADITRLAWFLDPAIPAVVDVGARPYRMASDGHFLWVANFSDDGAGTVSVVDPDTNMVVDTISPGGFVNDVSYADGVMYVAVGAADAVSDGTLLRFDTTTRQQIGGPIGVGIIPRDIVVIDDTIFVANNGPLPDPGNDSVSVIPVGLSSEVLPRIVVGDSPTEFARTNDKLYVANFWSNSVTVIDPDAADPAAAPIATVGVGANPTAIVFAAGFLWVANQIDGTVSVIDPLTDSVVDTINVGGGPRGLAYDGSSLYVTSTVAGNVWVIDPSTRSVTGQIDVEILPAGIVYDGLNLWVSENEATGRVERILPR